MKARRMNIEGKNLSRLATILCALVLVAAPLVWAWQLEQMAASALAAPGTNPPVKGRLARQAIRSALDSGYAPGNEEPEVLLVNTPGRLPSLLIAQAGDLVLVYRRAHFVLLYDPITARILNRAPLYN